MLPIVLTFIQKMAVCQAYLANFLTTALQNKVQSWVNVDTNNDGIDADDIARLFDHQDIENICQKQALADWKFTKVSQSFCRK